jgi:hypothetical protein
MRFSVFVVMVLVMRILRILCILSGRQWGWCLRWIKDNAAHVLLVLDDVLHLLQQNLVSTAKKIKCEQFTE